MFDLRTMSTVAPMGDLVMSIGLVFGVVFVANLLVVPALASLDRDAARSLMLWSVFALIGPAVVLAVHPPAFFVAVLGYLLIFGVSGGVLGWRHLRSIRMMGRIVAASLLVGVAVAVSATLVHMPR